jgi:hypothetical protein
VQSGLPINEIRRARAINKRVMQVLDAHPMLWDDVFVSHVLSRPGRRVLSAEDIERLKDTPVYRRWKERGEDPAYPNRYMRLMAWIIERRVRQALRSGTDGNLRLIAGDGSEGVGFIFQPSSNLVALARYDQRGPIDYQRGTRYAIPALDMLQDHLGIQNITPVTVSHDNDEHTAWIEAFDIPVFRLFDAIYYMLDTLRFEPVLELKIDMPNFLESKIGNKYTR